MSILSGVITQQIAAREGVTDTTRYLLLGWILGSSPVGLGIALTLANQEASAIPSLGRKLKAAAIAKIPPKP